MDNILLLTKDKETEELSKQFGFTKTLFLDDVVLIKEDTEKNLLKKIRDVKKSQRVVICQPLTEELLRFALEKTAVDAVIGMEKIHAQDSVHFVRSGLDQIVCKIAFARGKMIVFSFSDILNSKNRPQLMSRMMFNIMLCKKYNVKMMFSNFSTVKTDIRSKNDLAAFRGVLNKRRKWV